MTNGEIALLLFVMGMLTGAVGYLASKIDAAASKIVEAMREQIER
jgi:hypothetical protein